MRFALSYFLLQLQHNSGVSCRYLELHHNALTHLPDEFCDLVNLQHLDLSYTQALPLAFTIAPYGQLTDALWLICSTHSQGATWTQYLLMLNW